jgi:hypothetical protein
MTHIKNIPHLLAHGITGKKSSCANPGYVPIGDESLITTRAAYSFSVNGAVQGVLGDFIPFYFWYKMPMLYVIQNGYNAVRRTSPENIVYLVCDIDEIVKAGYTFYFCDGHATDSFTSFYDNSQISSLTNILDLKAIKAEYWGGEDNLDLKRRKQAEFLVRDDIAPVYIKWFICYNDLANQMLISMGVNAQSIKIIPTAYY